MSTTTAPRRVLFSSRWALPFLLLCLLLVLPVNCMVQWSIGFHEFHEASKPFVELGGYVSGPEMGPLGGDEGIRDVRLDGTKTNDEDLLRLRPHLESLPGLQGLLLTNTQVTDKGLAYLESLPRLRFLRLDETQVTDKGLAHLAGLRHLEELYLHKTSVTPEGVANLQRKLPNCKIEYGPYPE